MPQPTLRDTILALARRYDFEEGHSLQDERLALRLFDELARLRLHALGGGEAFPAQPADDHDLGSSAVQVRGSRDSEECLVRTSRDLLSCAAILHDIGYVEGYESHHKTAFRLIMAEPIPGLSPHEQTLVAHVARYHRGGTPDPAKHPAFAALPVPDREIVEQLGAILRFADGLDRSHTNAVQDLRCELDGNRLIVTRLPGVNDDSERWAGQKKARWFEMVYGVQVVLQ